MVDPSALATWANAVTVGRLLLSPLMFWIIPPDDQGSWIAWGLWFVLCLSDAFDGYIARRHGTTRSGAFLDPLADKVLLLTALVALVVAGRFWWVPVAVIAVREVSISLFRSYWGRRGLAVPAAYWAKVKTVVQSVAVGLAVLPWLAETPWLADTALWVAVFLTVVTGLQYVHDGSRATRTTGYV